MFVGCAPAAVVKPCTESIDVELVFTELALLVAGFDARWIGSNEGVVWSVLACSENQHCPFGQQAKCGDICESSCVSGRKPQLDEPRPRSGVTYLEVRTASGGDRDGDKQPESEEDTLEAIEARHNIDR